MPTPSPFLDLHPERAALGFPVRGHRAHRPAARRGALEPDGCRSRGVARALTPSARLRSAHPFRARAPIAGSGFANASCALTRSSSSSSTRPNRRRSCARTGSTTREAREGERPESIGEAVHALQAAGVSADEMQALIERLEVCPTLTAHPTEARRRSVLDKLQAIGRALVGASGRRAAARRRLAAQQPLEEEVRRLLTVLWQTDELRATPLTVVDEAANTLYFIEHSILDILRLAARRPACGAQALLPGPRVHDRAFRAIRLVGRRRSRRQPERLRRSHVADADPPQATHPRTLHRPRRRAAARAHRQHAARRVSEPLLQSIAEDARTIALSAETLQRYHVEPYALKLVYIGARLAATLAHVNTLANFESPARRLAARRTQAPQRFSRISRSFERVSSESRRSARGTGSARSSDRAGDGVRLPSGDARHPPAQRRARTRGGRVIAAAHVLPPETKYSALPEEEKVALLTRELSNPRPLLSHDRSAPTKRSACWTCSTSMRNGAETALAARRSRPTSSA